MSNQPTYYFFLGIGGIGMSALARYFQSKGFAIAGYDKTSTTLTDRLEEEGMEIIFADDAKQVPASFLDNANCQVVYTPAIPKNSALLNYFVENGFSLRKRSEVLGSLSKKYQTIAVAGTHGKTTISTLIAHLLKSSGLKINALLGGISHNFNSNVCLDEDADILVTEADEYDRSFLHLHPNIAVITSVDPDHLDIYGEEKEILDSYKGFASQISAEGVLVSKKEVIEKLDVKTKSITYGFHAEADYTAENIAVKNGKQYFDLTSETHNLKDLHCGLPGMHNIENALAAMAVAIHLNVDPEKLRKALSEFTGVKRRFDTHINNERIVYIDDYAHHPKEIDALLLSVKQLYPGRKVTGIFQPHLFSRTRDFADDFAASLSILDELILLEIYPAREEPIEGITSQWLLDKVSIDNKKTCSLEEAVSLTMKSDLDVLLTIGAGNIDKLVEPLKKHLLAC